MSVVCLLPVRTKSRDGTLVAFPERAERKKGVVKVDGATERFILMSLIRILAREKGLNEKKSRRRRRNEDRDEDRRMLGSDVQE